MLAGRFASFVWASCTATFLLAISNSSMQAGVPLPSGGTLETVDFERHIMGLFGKAGCNNGSCHGSFQGKNGFRLSLFGFEPEKDFKAITRDIQGRRINPIEPDKSLLITKAIGTVKHEGGVRFSKDSWQYQIFREWVRQGGTWTKGSGAIQSLEMSPKEYVFCPPGKSVPVKITARFEDGKTEDITPFCDFRINDDAVATVSPLGVIKAVKPGDSGFVVSYRGNVVAARVLVPSSAEPGFRYPNLKANNFIDKEVYAKLEKLNVVPSELASDHEFLRRVTVDAIGSLPTPEEVRAFLKDTSPDKRAKKIDELLKHPLHAAVWATKFSDITGNNTDSLENPAALRPLRSQMWHEWFRKRIADNVPYDQIVQGVLLATSREGKTPEAWLEMVRKIDAEAAKSFDMAAYAERSTLDLFWRRQQNIPLNEWGEKTAAAFMGVRLECAQCHKHPTDRWTQSDYRAYANIFAQLNFPTNAYSTPELKKLVDAENAKRKESQTKPNNNQLNLVREMFIGDVRKVALMTQPETGILLNPKAPGGPEFKFENGKDVRADLLEWLRSPQNPFFAKSFVNRVWAHYFGVGLVDPVDDFSIANPPSNARLLNALAKEFIDHKFDIRHIERTILMSRTYQTTSTPNKTNKFDKNNFARSYVRPMMAEVTVDVLNAALGVSETYGNEIPNGKKMVEIGSSRVQNPNVAYALRIFGRPPRTTACDCERAMEPALPQTLYRMTDNAVLQKLKAPDNRLNRLLKSKIADEELLDELFLATLGRSPNQDEKATFLKYRKSESDRAAIFLDTLWALINTREFVLNH